MQCEYKMTLPEWWQCRGDPWRFSRDRLREEMKRAATLDDVPADWSPLLKAAALLAWHDEDDTTSTAA